MVYAQSLADAGDYEKAVSVLEEGYVQTGRESLKGQIEHFVVYIKNVAIYALLPTIPTAQAETYARRLINIFYSSK